MHERDPGNDPLRRGRFLPKQMPEERWGLLTPAAIALAALLVIAFFVLRSGG
jgi:hypothetical protein